MQFPPDDIHIYMGSCSHTTVIGMRPAGREFGMLVADEPSTWDVYITLTLSQQCSPLKPPPTLPAVQVLVESPPRWL